MKSILLLPAMLLLSTFATSKSFRTDAGQCDMFNLAVKPYIEQGIFQGNIILAKGGQIICQVSYGFADANKQQAIGPSTLFPVASLSKPIVATLLLKLQENDAIDLNKSIAHYLPSFRANWADKVTIHHLLSNRSGLPNHFMLPGWDTQRYQTSLPKSELLETIANMTLSFSPGEQYQYSNLGWLLLGEIVESATNKSLEENLKQHIFTPLSMSQTGMVYGTQKTLVTGFRWGKDGDWKAQTNLHMQVFHGGAGIYATTGNLLKYLHALHRGDLLTSDSKKRMFDSESTYAWNIKNLSFGDQEEKLVHTYNGQLKGHSSFVYQVLEDNVSVILLNNTGMGVHHKRALANDLLSAFYKVPFSARIHSPSFQLSRSLLDGKWATAIAKLTIKPIEDFQDATLVFDLAQQLEWSGNQSKAIDLLAWLVNSLPEQTSLQSNLERLCKQHPSHHHCKGEEKVNVGMQMLRLVDAERQAWRQDTPRPITTHVFYPTLNNEVESFTLGANSAPSFIAGLVVKSAKPEEGKYPLVLMSHGTGGSAPQLLWLAQALVEAGYVVAAVNHHGNTALEPQKYPEGFLLWWERARDLQVVLEQVSNASEWQRFIDPERIAVVGFSLGGYTAMSTLGAITDKKLFNAYCQNATDDFSCQPQPEFSSVLEAFEEVANSQQVVNSNRRQSLSYKIANLKAAVVIAPALAHSFHPNSLEKITTPTLFIGGSKDRIAQSKANAEYMHSMLPNSELATIDKAHHYSFLSRCTQHGKQSIPELCESPFGIPREKVHEQAISKTIAFINQNL